MRTVEIGSQKHTIVTALDGPGPGNASHKYRVIEAKREDDFPPRGFASVEFQEGPIKEEGVNGCHNEDLIAIVIDRLQGFQQGRFKCRENALAITKLEEALHWLRHRTDDRTRRGVEGFNIE